VSYEVKRWLLANDMKKKLAKFNDLCYELAEFEFDKAVWQKSIQIYVELSRRGELIDDADIFIAAFCIVNAITLVTNNTNHFKRVSDLKFVNWK
jgi:predicted nucleic acid-binding protein